MFHSPKSRFTNFWAGPKRVGIFVFDGFEPIDVWGFAEAFTDNRVEVKQKGQVTMEFLDVAERMLDPR